MLERNVFVSGHNVYASQEENAQNEDTLPLDLLSADVMATMENYPADLSGRSGFLAVVVRSTIGRRRCGARA